MMLLDTGFSCRLSGKEQGVGLDVPYRAFLTSDILLSYDSKVILRAKDQTEFPTLPLVPDALNDTKHLHSVRSLFSSIRCSLPNFKVKVSVLFLESSLLSVRICLNAHSSQTSYPLPVEQ